MEKTESILELWNEMRLSRSLELRKRTVGQYFGCCGCVTKRAPADGFEQKMFYFSPVFGAEQNQAGCGYAILLALPVPSEGLPLVSVGWMFAEASAGASALCLTWVGGFS